MRRKGKLNKRLDWLMAGSTKSRVFSKSIFTKVSKHPFELQSRLVPSEAFVLLRHETRFLMGERMRSIRNS